MHFAGLKKQINKANQFVTEKIGGAEGTKLDKEYIQCEKQIDIMAKLIEEIINRTHEYMQPNPATRAKMVTVNTFNKIQGKAKYTSYPQPEGLLGDCMVKYGTELGSESLFGECLVCAGQSFKSMEEIKFTMEDQVKTGYIDPLRGIQAVELKEIGFHRKKLEGRRLDYDCKKRRKDNMHYKSAHISDFSEVDKKNDPSTAKVIEDEVKVAEEKFQESKNLAETAMTNFLSSDLDHISALAEFVEAQVCYFRQATEIMETLHKYLMEKKDEAGVVGKREHIPKPQQMTGTLSGDVNDSKNGTHSPNMPTGNRYSLESSPCCRALYQFDAENNTELNFAEGDIIQLIRQVDENWFEGRVNDNVGFFPVNYVEVMVPLTQSPMDA